MGDTHVPLSRRVLQAGEPLLREREEKLWARVEERRRKTGQIAVEIVTSLLRPLVGEVEASATSIAATDVNDSPTEALVLTGDLLFRVKLPYGPESPREPTVVYRYASDDYGRTIDIELEELSPLGVVLAVRREAATRNKTSQDGA